jgi:general secretion pathway protein I
MSNATANITDCKARHQQVGFTLLEVMVAMFIFAVAGAAIIKTTTEHISSVGKLEEMTFATWVANNQLTRASLKSSKTWPPKNNERGSVDMLDRTWYWQQEVQSTSDDDLKAIIITVGNDPEYKGSIISVTTYVAKSDG